MNILTFKWTNFKSIVKLNIYELLIISLCLLKKKILKGDSEQYFVIQSDYLISPWIVPLGNNTKTMIIHLLDLWSIIRNAPSARVLSHLDQITPCSGSSNNSGSQVFLQCNYLHNIYLWTLSLQSLCQTMDI